MRSTRREILCSRSPGETRIAVLENDWLENDRLVDVAIMRDGLATVGSIHYGRVVGQVSGLGAVFVDIGGERPGFLAAPPASLHEGEAVMVQVTHAARGDKGAKLTLAVALAGVDVVFSPFRPGVAVSRRISDGAERDRLAALARSLAIADEGLVVRAHAVGAHAARLASAIASLRQRWLVLAARPSRLPTCVDVGPDPLEAFLVRLGADEIVVRCDTLDLATRARLLCREFAPALEACVSLHQGEDLFSLHGVDGAIEEALEPTVPLAGGGCLHIEPTAAVVAIDVDSGGAGHGALAVNLEAAGEIARQIRLRNLSGHMVVDFIGMRSPGDLRRVVTALRLAVTGVDATTIHVAGPTALGLVEVVRERHRPPLAEFMRDASSPCGQEASVVAVALGGLRAVLREAAVAKVGGLGLDAAPDVVAALRGPLRLAMEEAESVLGHRLELRATGTRHHVEVVRRSGKEK